MTAIVNLSLAYAGPSPQFELERNGYFVAGRVGHVTGTKPMVDLAAGLRDSWGKIDQ